MAETTVVLIASPAVVRLSDQRAGIYPLYRNFIRIPPFDPNRGGTHSVWVFT